MWPVKRRKTIPEKNDELGLRPKQREHLETFFQHIVSTATVDFTSQEIKDLQYAVKTMLERIADRINKRGVFDISRIVPTGSMAEDTSIWKNEELIDGEEHYLEFDYLAILKELIRQCEDHTAQNNCPGCIKIFDPPVDLFAFVRDRWNHRKYKNSKTVMDEIFMNEIHNCLIASCDCLISNHTCKHGEFKCYSYKPSSVDTVHGCDMCTVDTPTGTLSVNTEKSVDNSSFFNRNDLNKCSLILQWTSKTNSMLAPDELLLQKHPVVSLPIYVDFLPALESLKPSTSGDEYEHDYFIVPKDCNVCRYSIKNDEEYRWRKSRCMAEIRAFRTEISNKHRICYQITKYLTSLARSVHLNKYLIKNVVLKHSIRCSDTTYDCVDCAIEVYHEILQAYNSKACLSYHSNINIAITDKLYFDSEFKAKKAYFQAVLSELCSVSETDTRDTFVSNFLYDSESAAY